LAVRACENLLAGNVGAMDGVDFILVSTTTPDHPLFPSVAALLGHRLNLGTVPGIDISAACTGFIYTLSAATAWIKSGMYKKILIVCADTLSHFLDWEDRNTCVLFGDGAGALILEAGPEQGASDILAFDLHTDGAGAHFLNIPDGGSRSPFSERTWQEKRQFLRMDGQAVYKFAVSVICETLITSLGVCGLEASAINHFVPHQANIRIIDSAAKRFGLAPDVVRTNLEKYGNTSSASIPLVLDEIMRNGKLQRGDIVAVVGFGAGLTWGSAIIRW
jgi:3-oxoacyl-[acyl-carrier-protein] synthase-3